MRYILPPPEMIFDIANQLKKLPSLNTPNWPGFIVLINKLTQIILLDSNGEASKQGVNILVGSVIFALEIEYSSLLPERVQKIHLLEKVLNISADNVLTDDTRLYYLNKFFRGITKYMNEDLLYIKEIDKEVHEIIWQGKDELLEDIKKVMKTVIDRDAYRIGLIVHATPELLTVRKATKEIANLYVSARKKRWSWFQHADRQPILQLLQFLDFTFYDLPPSKDKKKINIIQEEEWSARCGLIIFMLLDIQSSSFLSPKGTFINSGSELYKIALPVLKINDLSELTNKQKKKWLKSLSNYVSFIQEEIGYYQNKKKYTLKDIKEVLMRLQDKIEKLRAILTIEQTTPSTSSWLVSTGTSFITRQGLSYLMNAVTLTGVGAAIAANIGGVAAGIAVYAGGTLLTTGLGNFIQQNALPETAATYIYAWILEKIGSHVGDSAANMISYQEYQYTPTKGGLTALRKSLSEEEDQDFIKWVNTLLFLSEDVFSEEKKQIIRNVLALEMGQKLKPCIEYPEVKQAALIEKTEQLPRVTIY